MIKKLLTTASCITSLMLPLYAQAGEVSLSNGSGASFSTVPVVSYKEELFEDVVRQQYDFSCGSASLATLLYHHYYYNVTERDVLKAMFEAGDKDKILKKGFSLFDMKQYLETVGIKSDGYSIGLEKLQKIGVPAIALINSNGYLHFVVVKGVHEDVVLIGDPSLGTRKMARNEFEKIWNKIAFVIKSDAQIARSTFNVASSWNIRGKAEFSTALSNEALSSISVHVSPTPNYY